MSNYALIFAGGTGQRMNSKSLPKQFLSIHGKPIIMHTILQFENSKNICGIVVVCLESYIAKLRDLLTEYGINKVMGVVPGGNNGQQSIYNGLNFLFERIKGDDIVLIHDGVRPLIEHKLITENINCVKKNGNAITVSRAIETVVLVENDNVTAIENREKCFYAKAPQSFYFKDIYDCHNKAVAEKRYNFIDSATMMQHYGYKLFTVLGDSNNIKITTQMDYFMFKGMLDSKELSQMKVKL